MAKFGDLREASDEKSQCLIFLTVILTWVGNKDKSEECKHITVFDGYLDKDLVKDIERIAFSSKKVVIASDEKKGKDFSDKYRPNDRVNRIDFNYK